MNQKIVQKLKEWRSKRANQENLELYLILQNQTIEAIAKALPSTKEEFLEIKGLGEKKFERYGQEILRIVAETTDKILPESADEITQKVLSVGEFLSSINSNLANFSLNVMGEISSVNYRENYLFFTIKDSQTEACMDCFMWSKDYEISGITLKEGIEIIIHGFPEIYPRNGRFTYRTSMIELVGEGILKKRYDELKKKLESEGLFKSERKKLLPSLPSKIGLITSKDGAVIHDFQSNLGRFGYKITLVDSRVEGAMAVKDLINAIRYFRNKDIDVLVVMRGGGSLESLQSFNNEALVREIIDFPVPIICGIGHDKDVPLFSFVADKAVSTPTAVAREINKSWEQAIERIDYYQSNILHSYRLALTDNRHIIDQTFLQTTQFYQRILKKIETFTQNTGKIFTSFSYVLKQNHKKTENCLSNLFYAYSGIIDFTNLKLKSIAKVLEQNNPSRQLKLGYSIIFSKGKVVKSVSGIRENELLDLKLSDGQILSEVKKVESEI